MKIVFTFIQLGQLSGCSLPSIATMHIFTTSIFQVFLDARRSNVDFSCILYSLHI